MKAAANDIRAGEQTAGLFVYCQHNCYQAFFGQQHAVFNNNIADNGAGLVYKIVPCGTWPLTSILSLLI
jgi:hypothetical protein